MSESDSFISEVSEEVRRDRLYSFLSRWGWLIAIVLVAIVLAAAIVEWRKARSEARNEAVGALMRAAYAETDPTARAAALGAVATELPHAATIARLAQAGSLRQAGDAAGAGALLGEIAADQAVPQLYRSLAGLERVMVLGPSLETSERLATLEALVAPGAPFRSLALEQRALVRLESGDTAQALTDLEAVLAEPTATEALRSRASQLIIAAGGALPVGDAAPAVPADG